MSKVCGETVEDNGHFYVTSWSGRNFLYTYFDQRIAECVNGDYKERFGGLSGWLRHISKRSEKRLDKVEETLVSLEDEQDELNDLISRIGGALRNGY